MTTIPQRHRQTDRRTNGQLPLAIPHTTRSFSRYKAIMMVVVVVVVLVMIKTLAKLVIMKISLTMLYTGDTGPRHWQPPARPASGCRTARYEDTTAVSRQRLPDFQSLHSLSTSQVKLWRLRPACSMRIGGS